MTGLATLLAAWMPLGVAQPGEPTAVVEAVLAPPLAEFRLGVRPISPGESILDATPAGLALGAAADDDDGVTRVVSWDNVRAVRGPAASRAEPFLDAGLELWRARTRLQRGDSFGAEPLFERLYARFASSAGPTPAIVAEGLLRCRLRRGALTSAVPPWLTLRRAAESPAAATGPSAVAPAIAGLRPVLDPETGLVPALPPIWLDDRAVSVFADRREALPPAGTRAGVLADLYHTAALLAIGRPIPPEPLVAAESLASTDSGVRIVWTVVASQLPPGPLRNRGVRGLREMLADAELLARLPWSEPWARAALGSAMIAEPDADTRELGIVQLLHVPARFSEDASYLSGVCLARAAEAAATLGDTGPAARLRAELAARYAGHPALITLSAVPSAPPADRPGSSPS